jgi:hypothetical protein
MWLQFFKRLLARKKHRSSKAVDQSTSTPVPGSTDQHPPALEQQPADDEHAEVVTAADSNLDDPINDRPPDETETDDFEEEGTDSNGTGDFSEYPKQHAMKQFENDRSASWERIPVEFQYLENLIAWRLGQNALPLFPELEYWELPVKHYIRRLGFKDDPRVCTLLLIALAPHAFPDLFDRAIQDRIRSSGDFPEIGGVRGKNFRGFLPTGQTAAFLMAGENWEERSSIEQLFWSGHELSRRKVLWLEELPQGEPVMSGRIIMALDYVDLFLYDTAAPPHFSTSFPARKITTTLELKDIVMNAEVKRHFSDMEDWIQHNDALLTDWGMGNRLRKGFRVLFYGPPGTGKTLTATVLGNQTKKDVYKIDLSMVVSKYIGETEKNLELLFARAEDKDWILFFDEADAIFGKRTSVRDAHDKYANQEVSYLLQRIEDYNGLVILATNMKNNIDDAFIRRFNDIVRFAIPGEDERKEIWIKSFPKNADYGDIPEKVKRFDISGANIINAVQYAGIQALRKRSVQGSNETIAADDKLKFYLPDIIEGIKRETNKEGRPFA